MDFREFLPKGFEEEIEEEEITEEIEKINQNQVYDIITSRKPDWQSIIYEMVHTEQLDPWDLDLVILTKKYFEKIEEMRELDFYISSKVLLAAALLLRIKSEFLLNKHIKEIDEIFFGRKKEVSKPIEKIEIEESEIPILIPKTPMSRSRKVSLSELMIALNKAINTESRRIKREVAAKRAKKLSYIDIPEFKKINLKDRIKQFYEKIILKIKGDKTKEKITYSELTKNEKEEKIATFLPLLHLSNTKKIWLEQNNHLDEIWIYMFEYFERNRDRFISDLEEDIKEMKEEISELLEEEKSNTLEKARDKTKKNREIAIEAKKELIKELGINIDSEIENINEENKIDKLTEFSQEN